MSGLEGRWLAGSPSGSAKSQVVTCPDLTFKCQFPCHFCDCGGAADGREERALFRRNGSERTYVMMSDAVRAVILHIIEVVTEFLPVASTVELVQPERVFNPGEAGLWI